MTIEFRHREVVDPAATENFLEIERILRELEFGAGIIVAEGQIVFGSPDDAATYSADLTWDVDSAQLGVTGKIEMADSSADISAADSGAFRVNGGKIQFSQDGSAWQDLDSLSTLPTLTETYIGYGDASDELTGDAEWIRDVADNHVRLGPDGLSDLHEQRDAGAHTGNQTSIVGVDDTAYNTRPRLVFARAGAAAQQDDIGHIVALSEPAGAGSYTETCRIAFERDTTYVADGGLIGFRVKGNLGSYVNAPLTIDSGHNVRMVNSNVATSSTRGYVSIGRMTGNPNAVPDTGNSSLIMASSNRLMTYDSGWMHPNERIYTQREVFSGDQAVSRAITIYDYQGTGGHTLDFSVTHESGSRGSEGKMWFVFHRGSGTLTIGSTSGAVIAGGTSLTSGEMAIVVDTDDGSSTDYYSKVIA